MNICCIRCLQNIYQLFPTLQLTGFTFCADLYYHIKPNQDEVVFYHGMPYKHIIWLKALSSINHINANEGG